MRDRLIELLYRAHHNASCVTAGGEGGYDEALEEEARYLLENGVIVPPCKVGDVVYFHGGINHRLVKSAVVEEIIINDCGISDLLVTSENGVTFENSIDIFYFTIEAAEAALKERERG